MILFFFRWEFIGYCFLFSSWRSWEQCDKKDGEITELFCEICLYYFTWYGWVLRYYSPWLTTVILHLLDSFVNIAILMPSRVLSVRHYVKHDVHTV